MVIYAKGGDRVHFNQLILSKNSEVSLSITYRGGEFHCSIPEESHFHKECEIYINLSGDVSFEVEGGIYGITRGSVIITRPYENHHCIYHSDAPHEHFWLLIHTENDNDLFRMFFDRKSGSSNLFQLTEEQLTAMIEVLSGFLQPAKSELEYKIAFLQMMKLLEEGVSISQTVASYTFPEDIRYSMRYMDEHLTENLDIRKLAEDCHVSVSTLERHFRKYLATAPYAAFQNKRLVRSSYLLRTGSTVSEACEMSGFPDYSSYIELFRKYYGCTPLKYKKLFYPK